MPVFCLFGVKQEANLLDCLGFMPLPGFDPEEEMVLSRYNPEEKLWEPTSYRVVIKTEIDYSKNNTFDSPLEVEVYE